LVVFCASKMKTGISGRMSMWAVCSFWPNGVPCKEMEDYIRSLFLQHYPRGELWPLGWTLTSYFNVNPFVHQRGLNTLRFNRKEGLASDFHPCIWPTSCLGDKVQPGANFTPGGSNLTPRGVIKNWPQLLSQRAPTFMFFSSLFATSYANANMLALP
jgi:hypothetical protein